MLIELLGLSAALVAAATLVLLLAGRRPLPGYPLRAILLGALALVVAMLLGYADPTALKPELPSPANPATLAGLAILVVALAAPRRWWAAGAVTFGSLTVATVLYVVYLFGVTIDLSVSPAALLLGIVLLALQVVALGLMVSSVFEMVDSLCGPVEVPRRPPDPAEWPTVAFQIPVHQEPPELVIRTIRSLLEVEYPAERLIVQVLDNNTTDESLWRPLETECARLREAGRRVEFVHLEDWPGYKAGALNYGTAHLPEDAGILVVVDADYVVAPGFLRATVPYFEDPKVAFVQTPQEYRGWRSSGFYRACHTGFAYFFKVGMISRSYRNSIIFAGTMGLLRRSALDRIGGWDENVITEDAEASLRLLSLGYRSVYVPEAYGRGIMPLTYEGLRQQRFRWAFGGMQILRKHWRALLPWSQSGLDQRQRRDYLLGGLGWVNDALTIGFTAFIAVTAVGYLTGHPFAIQQLTGIGLILPVLYITLGLVRYLWGLRAATGASAPESAAALRVNLSLSWVVTLALIRGAIEKQGVFLRTPKFRGVSATIRQLRVVWVEAIVAAVTLALAVAVFVQTGLSILSLTIGTLLVWSAIVYGSAVDFALGDPTRPPEALREKAALEVAGAAVTRAARRAPAFGGIAVGLGAIVVVVALVLGTASQPAVPGGGPALPPRPIAQAPTPTRAKATPARTTGPTPTAGPTAAPATPTPAPATPAPTPPPSIAPVPTAPAPGAT